MMFLKLNYGVVLTQKYRSHVLSFSSAHVMNAVGLFAVFSYTVKFQRAYSKFINEIH